MTTPVEQNGFLLAFLFRTSCLFDNRRNGVVRFGCGDIAFRTSPFYTAIEGIQLVVGPGLYQFFLGKMTDYGSHSMVPEATGMDRSRDKIMTQRVHGKERRRHGKVAEIIGKGPSREGRT